MLKKRSALKFPISASKIHLAEMPSLNRIIPVPEKNARVFAKPYRRPIVMSLMAATDGFVPTPASLLPMSTSAGGNPVSLAAA
jgi:hypothetical protein